MDETKHVDNNNWLDLFNSGMNKSAYECSKIELPDIKELRSKLGKSKLTEREKLDKYNRHRMSRGLALLKDSEFERFEKNNISIASINKKFSEMIPLSQPKTMAQALNIKVVNTIDNPRKSSRQFFLSRSDCDFLEIEYVNGLEVFAL